MIPAIVYAAKSTQDRRGSIPTQIEDCRAMAEREGWTVVGEYTDEGFSAYSRSRGPGLASARDHAARVAAETGEVTMLVAQHSDRFSRGGGDKPGAAEALIEIWHFERRRNVHLRSADDDYDLRTSNAVANIGERNRSDSERKSKSVKDGMRRRAATGVLNGGGRPYGYRWEDGLLVIVEAEKRVVLRVYDAYLAGESQRSITRTLNADGIRTTRGRLWHQGTISGLLSDPLYKGSIRFNDEVLPGAHDGIVPLDTWEAVAARLAQLARTKGNGGGRPPNGKHLFVKGLLRCGACGSSMIPVTKAGGSYQVYECYGRHLHGVKSCAQGPVKRADVDSAMFGELQRTYLDLDGTRERIAARIQADLANARAVRQQAERDEMQATERLARVKRAFQDGHLDPTDWAEQRVELTAEHDAAAARVEAMRDHENQLTEAAPTLDVETELLAQLEAVRAALVDGIGQASNLAALRRMLHDVFEMVIYMAVDRPPTDFEWEDGHLPDDYVGRDTTAVALPGAFLDPVLRPGSIAGYGDDEDGLVPRRIGLPPSMPSDGVGFPTASVLAAVFGRIAVPRVLDDKDPVRT